MNIIHPTAIIYPNVTIGMNVEIGAYCIIGAPAEHKVRCNEEGKGVHIMDNVKITGHVTIDSGLDNRTTIGQGSFIMKGVHIGHDSIIGEDVILSPHVLIGGHCWIGNRCNIGMGAIIRNRKDVPQDVVIGMGTIVTRSCELWSGATFVGNPATKL